MAFVVGGKLPVGLHPEQAVVEMAIFPHHITPRDNGVGLSGHLVHPAMSGQTRVFGHGRSLHREARGEHFGQHNQISGLVETENRFLQRGPIRHRVMPVKGRLEEGNRKHYPLKFRKPHSVFDINFSFGNIGQFFLD